MSDHSDMRRRAAQHASYGNYWAGKCVGLLDEIERLGAAIEDALSWTLAYDKSEAQKVLIAAMDWPCDLTAALKGATDDR